MNFLDVPKSYENMNKKKSDLIHVAQVGQALVNFYPLDIVNGITFLEN